MRLGDLTLKPRSRGLPAGFLDQPFYGWVDAGRILSARFSGLDLLVALAVMLKPLIVSTLKRSSVVIAQLYPALKALV